MLINGNDNITVYGAPLQRTIQSSIPTLANPTGAPTLRNESEYAIDYDNLMIAFYPRIFDPGRKFFTRTFTIRLRITM